MNELPDVESPVDSALPPRGARLLAFLAILVSGLCGGLIGYAVTDLQCEGSCSTNNALGGLIGAALAAGGVAVVSVLALRAMGEWQTIQDRQERESAAGQDRNVSRRNPSA